MSAAWKVTLEYDSVEPMTVCPNPAERTWLGEVTPPAKDASPETWAKFSDALTWATRQITRG